MNEKFCPFCKAEITEEMHSAGICFGCGISFSHYASIKEAEKEKAAQEAAQKEEISRQQVLAEMHSRITNFLVTTGYNYEGYSIKKYLGVVHGECVLGTGFISDASATISDIFGITSTKIEKKMSNAKLDVEKAVILAAAERGANAVIGLDFDISTIYTDMIMVSANATAVFIEEKA